MKGPRDTETLPVLYILCSTAQVQEQRLCGLGGEDGKKYSEAVVCSDCEGTWLGDLSLEEPIVAPQKQTLGCEGRGEVVERVGSRGRGGCRILKSVGQTVGGGDTFVWDSLLQWRRPEERLKRPNGGRHVAGAPALTMRRQSKMWIEWVQVGQHVDTSTLVGGVYSPLDRLVDAWTSETEAERRRFLVFGADVFVGLSSEGGFSTPTGLGLCSWSGIRLNLPSGGRAWL